jgi:hypothetical protein|tara:strand:+ start:201 stop:368 length:168 start_codon:yes stop_codon:yes gene_type:complete
MTTVAVSFMILFGGSYGVSSMLLKRSIKTYDPSYRSQETLTRLYRIERSKEDWFR